MVSQRIIEGWRTRLEKLPPKSSRAKILERKIEKFAPESVTPVVEVPVVESKVVEPKPKKKSRFRR